MAEIRTSGIIFVMVIFISKFHSAKFESLCDKDPRGPPASCCPNNYTSQCCPVAGDNETIEPCNKLVKPTNPPPIQINPPSAVNPGTACLHKWDTQACTGGFFLDQRTQKVKPCPRGFYCPQNLLCIIPCPSGAYCVPMQKTKEKLRECGGFGVCCGNESPLVLNKTRKCTGVKDSNCLCGGLDVPKPCPGGYYCPDTFTKIPCNKGHYCRPGSVVPDPCPFLTKCGRKVSAPIANFIAPLFDFLVLMLFVTLLLLYHRWRTVKFYCNLYLSRFTGKDRSPTLSFEVDAGIVHTLRKLGEVEVINEEIEPKTFTIDISFEDLGLELNAGENKGKIVLQGVTGHVRSGEVTAVMGPSGAGKTTFLNTLSGKAYYGVTSLNIYKKIV